MAVKKHKYASLASPHEKPTTWEEKLVYYADKRVMHDKVVPLGQRLDEAHARYRKRRPRAARPQLDIDEIDRLIFELEKEIFDMLDLNPPDITSELIESNLDAGSQAG